MWPDAKPIVHPSAVLRPVLAVPELHRDAIISQPCKDMRTLESTAATSSTANSSLPWRRSAPPTGNLQRVGAHCFQRCEHYIAIRPEASVAHWRAPPAAPSFAVVRVPKC
eukprot:1145624-Amphidinium_carterae.1